MSSSNRKMGDAAQQYHNSQHDSAIAGVTGNRPRASSGVCVRPQLLTSRLRSRSLLKVVEGERQQQQQQQQQHQQLGSSSSNTVISEYIPQDENNIVASTSSPKFGANLLPRIASVFGSSGSSSSVAASASGANSYQQAGSSKGKHTYSPASASSSSTFSSSERAKSSLSDSASLSLTHSGDSNGNTDRYDEREQASSSSTTSSIPSSFTAVDSSTSSFTPSSNKGKSTGSPISSLPFLPRRRTLSNLFNQFTSNSGSSSKDKDKESSSSTTNTLNKKESKTTLSSSREDPISSPTSSNAPEMRNTMHVHLQQEQTQGWSTSSARLPSPSISSSTRSGYSNPFASAFTYNSSDSQALPRPSSPRLKKKDSYLALNIPPTPGVGTGSSVPSLAYAENGNRPLKGEDEDFMLPSPITESDADDELEQHPTHAHHRHAFQAPSSASPLYRTSETHSSLNGIAAQPISSSSSFLSSLTSTAPTLSTQRASHATLSTLLPPILFLCISFVISLTIMFFMVSTIPLTIPHNISEIKLQTVALRDYSRKGLSEGLHVSAVLSALFVFKQAFSVPGSILVNILFGSLYGTYAATVCACIFTGVGSVLAYYMARLCAPLVERFFPRALATTRSALLSGSSSDLFSYLLLARLFPLLPYSALNIACGVLKVPVKPYFTTLVLGSFPYNFVTTQLGDLLGSLANSAEAGNINAIWTWDLIFKLAVASILSAAPVIFKEQLKGIIGGSDNKDASSAGSPSRGLSRLEEESIPLAPLSATEYVEPESASYDNYASYARDRNAPLLRRDRTDSSASEVLFAPALELFNGSSSNGSNSNHKKQWSFSWSTLRRSLNNESACSASEYSLCSADTASFASHTTARTSLDEEAGDTDEEISREKTAFSELQRRSSGSSFQSFASRSSGNHASVYRQNKQGGHSRPTSIDYSGHGRRTASIESASSSPTVAQHHQFAFPMSGAGQTPSVRSSQEWDRF